ncbi:unnamed protein product [Allacma fusca]|uniref:MIF4G domain-containing protein n=1 Tax=Allacma fusca TaxID=39272 RepID=A0A8J2LFQ6_9HEXA|nr:unnamed protein product [Allacma fusca]
MNVELDVLNCRSPSESAVNPRRGKITSSSCKKSLEMSSLETEETAKFNSLDMRPHKFPAKNERDVLLRKVRSVLNKISSVNFHRLRKRWLNLIPSSVEQITEVLQLVVAKALDDPQYMNIYARLMGYVVNRRAPNSGSKIRSILHSQVHQELQKICTDKEIAKFSQSMEQEWIARRKNVTLHRFIAELYVENACSSRYLTERVEEIVTGYNHPENADESLECLCVVLTFAGQKLEETRKEWMDELVSSKLNLKESEKHAISKRIQFMVLDLLEMRSNSWAPHNKWWAPSVKIQNDGSGKETFSSATSMDGEEKSSLKTAENLYLDSTVMVTAGIATASRQRSSGKKFGGYRSARPEKTKTLQAILNKVTASTLTQMAEYMRGVLSSDPGILVTSISTILRKAISEPSYVQVYVKLISVAGDLYPDLEKTVSAEVIRAVEEDTKSLGGIRLLAELFNADIVACEDVQKMIQVLLVIPGDAHLESLCNLIFLTGKKLEAELKDVDSGANFLDPVLDKMLERANRCFYNRLKCFILDIFDLRKNEWVPLRPLNYIHPCMVDPLKKPYDIGSIIRIIAKHGLTNANVVRASLCSRSIAEKFVFEALDWAIQDGGEEASKLITCCLKIVMKEKCLADVRPRLQLIVGKLVHHMALLKGKNKNSDTWLAFGRIMDELYSQ